MKKIALFAAVSSFALALAACGGSDDASEDAMADSVEMPADEAMADMPMPAADADEAAEDAEASPDDAMAADTVWVPANSFGRGVLADLASPGAPVTITGSATGGTL